MVSAVWRMKPFAFKQMWEHFGYEYLPYPLSVRPTSDTIEEHRLEQLDAIDEALKTLREWYEPALVALSDPEVRVEILGRRAGELIRVHVGVRDEISCIATQVPGREPDIGGDVTLRAVRSVDVGRALVKMFDINVSGAFREWRFSGRATDADEQAKERELEMLTANGVDGILPVGILPGPIVDNWDAQPGTLSFDIIHVRGKGDFVLNKGARQVVSATPDATAKAFDTYISAVRRTYESRG